MVGAGKKYYDCVISYHPGKANVVADALSRKSLHNVIQRSLIMDLQREDIDVVLEGTVARLFALVISSSLSDRIRIEQQVDEELMSMRKKAEEKGMSEFGLNGNGLLTFKGSICVPIGGGIRQDVLAEAHTAPYSIHPGGTKMYQDLKRMYWWPGMKKSIGVFVSECLTCQQVKIEHQRPAGTLQSLPIPQWKWDHVTMDFVVGLPRTQQGFNSIWVVVDRLTKSAHFLPVKITFTMNQYARVYIDEIVRLHGIPVSIVSDRDPRFTSEFWKSLHRALGTRLAFSTAYHPQSDGQSERVIQVLEDLLRSCTIDFPGSWDSMLSLVEFTYNNSFQATIGWLHMRLFMGGDVVRLYFGTR